MNNLSLAACTALFGAGLAFSWVTQGTGVVENDPSAGINIPEELQFQLQVQAAYNDDTMFMRMRWPSATAGVLHEFWVYDGSEWNRERSRSEDRLTFLLDDGSIPEFGRYGGYITAGAGVRGLPGAPTADDIRAHPTFSTYGISDLRKSVPSIRTDQQDWASARPREVLDAQRAAGQFLDLWHWRGGRANAIGFSDDQIVDATRRNDAGRGPNATNFDSDAGHPVLMFDPEVTGFRSWTFDEIGNIGFHDVNALLPTNSVPFDPDAGWQAGDTLPYVYLREPDGARAAIRVGPDTVWENGMWDLTLVRALDTGFPLDDKILKDQGEYQIAFAVHRDNTGNRWHYVSLPYTLDLGRGDAAIVANKFSGATPTWGNDWTTVEMFYPGVITYPMLLSNAHAGADKMRQGIPADAHHTPEQLARYAVESEFTATIQTQWWQTTFAGLILIAGFGFAGLRLTNTRKEA